MQKNFSKQNIQGGFTLIELMVSLSIFAIVMTISAGTLLVLIDLNAKAQAIYSATTNIAFAIDTMSREIRTGYHYNCYTTDSGGDPSNLPAGTGDCAVTPLNSVAFNRESDGVRVGYRLNGGSIERKEGASGNWTPLTSEDVSVETFAITVDNSTTYDDDTSERTQPIMDIVIQGYVNNGLDTDTDFNVQTRMVGRRLDVL